MATPGNTAPSTPQITHTIALGFVHDIVSHLVCQAGIISDPKGMNQELIDKLKLRTPAYVDNDYYELSRLNMNQLERLLNSYMRIQFCLKPTVVSTVKLFRLQENKKDLNQGLYLEVEVLFSPPVRYSDKWRRKPSPKLRPRTE